MGSTQSTWGVHSKVYQNGPTCYIPSSSLLRDQVQHREEGQDPWWQDHPSQRVQEVQRTKVRRLPLCPPGSTLPPISKCAWLGFVKSIFNSRNCNTMSSSCLVACLNPFVPEFIPRNVQYCQSFSPPWLASGDKLMSVT